MPTNIDNAPSYSITDAAAWIEGVLLGPIASMAAIVAIAVIGLTMLSGRVPLRRGITMVV